MGQVAFKTFWQFNHMPMNELWSVTERPGAFRIRSGKICTNIMQAYNTLTQRTFGPKCSALVTVDGSGLMDGDYAGICAFQGCYGAIAVTKEEGQYYLAMMGKPAKDESIFGEPDYISPAVEYERIPINHAIVTLKIQTDFTNKLDEAQFFYMEEEVWKPLGIIQKLYFKMDHCTGCRFGLYYFSTKKVGGKVDFMKFRYHMPESQIN